MTSRLDDLLRLREPLGFDRVEHARVEGNLVLNVTPSMALGAYIRMPLTPTLGAIVSVPLIDLLGETAARVIYNCDFDMSVICKETDVPLSSVRMLKRIVATAGADIEIEHREIRVNGKLCAWRATREEQVQVCGSDALPYWTGRKRLEDGEALFLCDANDPLSLDGRFCGPSNIAIIESVLSPLSQDECDELERRVDAHGWVSGHAAHV